MGTKENFTVFLYTRVKKKSGYFLYLQCIKTYMRKFLKPRSSASISVLADNIRNMFTISIVHATYLFSSLLSCYTKCFLFTHVFITRWIKQLLTSRKLFITERACRVDLTKKSIKHKKRIKNRNWRKGRHKGR